MSYFTCGFTHMRPHLWEGRPGVPVMIVASNYLSAGGTLRVRPVPGQCSPTFCDSGGYFFHAKGTDYPFSRQQYIDWLTAMRPTYAACMDYPCEAEVARDDNAVLSRQLRALDHAVALLAHQGSWDWLPVLQGRTVEQYVRHAAFYQLAGLVRPYMGIGSLCRRTKVTEITAIIRAVSAQLPGTRFHLFGVKVGVFKQAEALPSCVESADTGAWNSMFGPVGRGKWKAAQARGLTQAEYELHEALPAYHRKVQHALSQPKQMGLEVAS